MEFWNKAQKPAAIVSGVLLIIIVIAIASRDILPQLGNYFQNIGRNDTTERNKSSDATKTDTTNKPATPEQPKASTPSTNKSDTYSYTAQAGDSYTTFARSAINTYGKAHSITLSPTEALNAEVALVNAAGSPELEIGQKVTITAKDIARVVPSTAATQEEAPSKSESAKDTSSADDYTYTAVAGDAYSWLARKAVSSYMSSAKVELSPAQRLAAEAALTTRAGSPLLEIGQKVAIPASDIEAAVEAARQLSAPQQAAWQTYVPLAAL